LPFVPQELCPRSAHWPAGSTWFTGTLVQVPCALGSAHDWQAPPQGELQQNPWAQLSPGWHSGVLAQLAPWPLRPQEFIVVSQVLGDLHWSLLVQTVKHSAPLQT
jgi:hypothetical protein